MKKKFFIVLLIGLFLITAFSVSVFAVNSDNNITIFTTANNESDIHQAEELNKTPSDTSLTINKNEKKSGEKHNLNSPEKSEINSVFSNNKKIIEFGSDAPSAQWVKQNVAAMEQTPFDGVAFVPGNLYSTIWRSNEWSNNPEYLDQKNLTNIPWKKFDKNNFLLLFSNKEDQFPLNLWNDEDWITIEKNMAALAKAAKISGCAGILLDTEYYSTESPWSYSGNNYGHSEYETRKKIEDRGAQIMNAWQEQYPDITILITTTGYYSSEKDYELLPYWINGMLDVIGPDARIVDGDEYSYYYPDTNYWPRMYDQIKISQTRITNISPSNEMKYARNMEVGKALNWDMDELNSSLNTPQIRKDRWEHNVYMSLLTTDKWVWTYSGTVNWWGVPVEYQPIHCQIPIGIVPIDAFEGILNAKKKYFNREGIGQGLKNYVPEKNTTITISHLNPITIEADSKRGDIYRVDFYLNNILVESDNNPPYNAYFKNISPGNYTLFALVNGYSPKENEDFWSTSQPMDITVPLSDEINLNTKVNSHN